MAIAAATFGLRDEELLTTEGVPLLSAATVAMDCDPIDVFAIDDEDRVLSCRSGAATVTAVGGDDREMTVPSSGTGDVTAGPLVLVEELTMVGGSEETGGEMASQRLVRSRSTAMTISLESIVVGGGG